MSKSGAGKVSTGVSYSFATTGNENRLSSKETRQRYTGGYIWRTERGDFHDNAITSIKCGGRIDLAIYTTLLSFVLAAERAPKRAYNLDTIY